MGEANEDIWALWLRAGRRTMVLEQCIATSEPAYLAKHAFQLAQEFNNFYHHHHILTEEDPERTNVPAGYGRRHPARTDHRAWLAGHRKPGSDVASRIVESVATVRLDVACVTSMAFGHTEYIARRS